MLHPTRLSLSSSGATPQAAQPPGMGKKSLEGWKCTHHSGVYPRGAASAPLRRAERVRWWRAPPHTRRALYGVNILHITTVASLWVAPHSPPAAAGGVSRTSSSIPPVAWGAWASPRYCGASSYASSGCSRWRHSLQYTLPGPRATALEQPSCLQRLPPPCAWQCGVPPDCAALGHPSFWHRLPPPCALQ
jgi:hypothetical protein